MHKDSEWLQSALDRLSFAVLRANHYGRFLLTKITVAEAGDLLKVEALKIQMDGSVEAMLPIKILKLDEAGANEVRLIDQHGNAVSTVSFDPRRRDSKAHRTATRSITGPCSRGARGPARGPGPESIPMRQRAARLSEPGVLGDGFSMVPIVWKPLSVQAVSVPAQNA